MATSREHADFYSKKARKEGFPARSVYKLEEIQQKLKIMKPGQKVLDIGAAPGSWTLYTQKRILGPKGSIVSIDLKPLSLNPLPQNVTFFQGDAFSEEMQSRLRDLGPFDTVISDAAPATTGNRSVDTLRSAALAESVIACAEENLKSHGNLVLKIFQGGGEQDIIKMMRGIFNKVKPLKPKACRDESFEIFLIGLDKKE